MIKIKFIASLTLIALTTSCGGGSTEKSSSTQIIKVLNRVECHKGYCSQKVVDEIWRICLLNNYQTITPQRNIVSARDIRELVAETVPTTKTITSYKEVTDNLGIVTKVPVQTTTKSMRTIRGYCLGSEYIQQK